MVVNLLWHSYVLDSGLVLFPITKVASIVNFTDEPFSLHSWRFRESAAWGHVGTWKSDEHCEGPGTACRLSPSLGGKTWIFIKKAASLKCRPSRKYCRPFMLKSRFHSPIPPPPWGGAPNLKESMYALIFSRSVSSQSQKRKYYIWKTFEHNYLLMVVIHSKYRQGETQPNKSSRANQPPLTNLVMDGPFSQQLRIMHSLSSREDLLSPHEHVVRIGVFLVGKKKGKLHSSLKTPKHKTPNLEANILTNSS